MKRKYFVRGLGVGILFGALIMFAAYMTSGKNRMSDEDVIKRAQELGMVKQSEYVLESDVTSQETTTEEITTEATTEKATTEAPTTTEKATTEKTTTEKATTEASTTEKADTSTQTTVTISSLTGFGLYWNLFILTSRSLYMIRSAVAGRVIQEQNSKIMEITIENKKSACMHFFFML